MTALERLAYRVSSERVSAIYVEDTEGVRPHETLELLIAEAILELADMLRYGPK